MAHVPKLAEVAFPDESAAPRDVTDGPLVIHVVNRTSQVVRLSIAFGNSAQMLGSVLPLESRDFVVGRGRVLAFRDIHLIAAGRDGVGRRVSEDFPLQNVSVVDWTVDDAMSRSVTLR